MGVRIRPWLGGGEWYTDTSIIAIAIVVNVNVKSHRRYFQLQVPDRYFVPIVTTFPSSLRSHVFCFACVDTAIVNIQPPHFTVMVLIDPFCALSQNEHSLCSCPQKRKSSLKRVADLNPRIQARLCM